MAEIAHRCGFSSHSHFSKVYHERCGQTPSEARERMRRRKAHVIDSHLDGVAPALTMQLMGMSYFPSDK